MDFEDDWKDLKRLAPFNFQDPPLDAQDDWDELRGRLTWYVAFFDEDQKLLPETKEYHRHGLPSVVWRVPYYKPAHYVGYWSRLNELKLSKLSEVIEPNTMVKGTHVLDGAVRSYQPGQTIIMHTTFATANPINMIITTTASASSYIFSSVTWHIP